MAGGLAWRHAGTVATSDPRFARVLELATKQPHLWVGPSGERVTGAEVGSHLGAAFMLMERDGWISVRRSSGPVELGHTLSGALWLVRTDGPGDADSWAVSRRCLNLILEARSESGSADFEAWSEKRGRRFGEVRDLLLITGEFARLYGPEAVR
ncbi:DUF6197 family protein [Streptomyces sparsogenes]|uniref:Uncharacterized protein n=1 Tax=Streptomyces sparsogenes DSM 40356 TaxID=1331668 RepID=A0A1R1S7W7_9ACTN|nr:hypothetical protein [Streptomyces sparsogenes]OMI34415.1 hypothetical protein SPAR_36566 [Streptomyces sparsogenes DSM 40356]